MPDLPPGVGLGTGRALPVSQRGWWTKGVGYYSCMFAALDSVLENAGYVTPLKRPKSAEPPRNFVLQLHEASGAPLNRGTTTGESIKALKALLPNAPVLFGTLPETELLPVLDAGAVARVIVPHCNRLPRHLRRWVGYGYTGGHAVALLGARGTATGTDVLWSDPMWKPAREIRGVWVDWASVAPALKKKNGELVVALAHRGTAMDAEKVAELEAENLKLKEDLAAADRENSQLEQELADANVKIAAALQALQ